MKKAYAASALIAIHMSCLLLTTAVQAGHSGSNDFIAICYHDIPAVATTDPHSVDLRSFIEQIEYLRTHGHHFINTDDILAANRNERPLPDNAVLLTFDDAYVSFYSNVVPVLELYECPALLAVCSSWIEKGAPEDIAAPLMTWQQIKEAAENRLITVASHSHDLHKAIRYNPQNNTAPATSSRMYFPDIGSYETEDQFRQRISADLKIARDLLRERTGVSPDILIWPFGEYNQAALEEAEKQDFRMMFTLENRVAYSDNIKALDRELVQNNPRILDFAKDIEAYRQRRQTSEESHTRAMQVSLDLIYDASPEQTEKNLDNFLDRVVDMGVDAVYLQAFADPDGDGNVNSVYFPNRVLPMKMDLLNRVANQLFIRGFVVYVWMPTLAVVLPDKEKDDTLLVMESVDGRIRSSTSWYKRLSPFNEKAQNTMTRLYEDLAAHVRFHGVLFQDDAYLTDTEDFNPAALGTYKAVLGLEEFKPQSLSKQQAAAWTRLKTLQLNDFTEKLMETVKRYRPQAKFARNLYAPVLHNPHSRQRFAQDYGEALKLYDRVVVMAYPEMEDVFRPVAWLENLVERAAQYPGGLEKTVFKIQAYDWKRKRWISDKVLLKRIRRLVARGAKAVAYYPDDYTVNKPSLKHVRMEMSTKTELFPRPSIPRTRKQY